ncbi:thioredoxin family protein [Parasphingorhabdus litoris]|nr:thioredoxin family protein [Parasphingorhabdus litoris]
MMKYIFFAAGLALAAPALSAPDTDGSAAEHPEARPYEKDANASQNVDAALTRAVAADKRVLLVMGANWCHDSRGLAGWFEKPRFAAMLKSKYEVVYVDVGQRDRNIDIAQRFGIEKIVGTPTVLVLSPRGALLNPKSAPTWRNAASRDEADIFAYFDQFTPEL